MQIESRERLLEPLSENHCQRSQALAITLWYLLGDIEEEPVFTIETLRSIRDVENAFTIRWKPFIPPLESSNICAQLLAIVRQITTIMQEEGTPSLGKEDRTRYVAQQRRDELVYRDGEFYVVR